MDPGGLADDSRILVGPRDADEGYGPDAACHAQAFLATGRAGEAVGQPVRGGLWEVDLAARRMACAYWPEPAHRVARGTWFIEKGADWVPLKVRASWFIEKGAARVPLKVRGPWFIEKGAAWVPLKVSCAPSGDPGSSRRAPNGCPPR